MKLIHQTSKYVMIPLHTRQEVIQQILRFSAIVSKWVPQEPIWFLGDIVEYDIFYFTATIPNTNKESFK